MQEKSTDVERHAPSRTNIGRYRAIVLSALAVVLVVFAWIQPLDEFAREKVAETTTETLGIYVISKSINAGISILQTSQVNLPLLASVQVGEVLDPVNDAVEKLSSIVTWALGSLLAQRILIEVMSSPIANLIFTSIALVTIAALLFMEQDRLRALCRGILSVPDSRLERYRDRLVRLFVTAAVLRFVASLVIAASFIVSQPFLSSEIAPNKERLVQWRAQIEAMTAAGSLSPDGRDLDEQKALEEARMKSLEASRASAVQTMEALDSTIDEIRDAAGWRRILPQGIGGVSPGDELAPAKEQRAEVRRELDRIEEDLRESEETLECIEERMAGGSCESLMERVSRVGGTGVSHIRDMFGRFNDMVTNVTMLLVAVAIENILFPILFLWGAMKCSFPVARQASRLLSGFEQDARKLKQDIRGRMTHDAET